MPDLRRVLLDYDLSLLQIIARLWGLEEPVASQREAVDTLVMEMLRPAALPELLANLPPDALAAWRTLLAGRQPLAQFVRLHGAVRSMGAARREREQPWLTTPSAAEVLWYRGLMASAFFDEGLGPEEMAFIPDDLRALVPAPSVEEAAPPGTPWTAPVVPLTPAGPVAVADLTTFLAYLQLHAVTLHSGRLPAGHQAGLQPFLLAPSALEWLTHLAETLALATGTPFRPMAATARPYLEAAEAEQIRYLTEAWRDSRAWNDLRQVPGLIFEGSGWQNDPVAARATLLRWLAKVPAQTWWSLDSFVAAIYRQQPDFQRRGGDYDSWYIRDAHSGAFLKGFAHWERVDGALIRWLLGNPLRWLGLVELAAEETDRAAVAFRVTAWGSAALSLGGWPALVPADRVQLAPDGLVCVPLRASPYTRFQIARVTDWLTLDEEGYKYRITPTSLERAQQRGITVARIVPFLREAVGELPAALDGALQRWTRAGREATAADMFVLRLKSPELLELLRATPSLQPYLGDLLGPTVVEIRTTDREAFRRALAEIGVLLD